MGFQNHLFFGQQTAGVIGDSDPNAFCEEAGIAERDQIVGKLRGQPPCAADDLGRRHLRLPMNDGGRTVGRADSAEARDLIRVLNAYRDSRPGPAISIPTIPKGETWVCNSAGAC